MAINETSPVEIGDYRVIHCRSTLTGATFWQVYRRNEIDPLSRHSKQADAILSAMLRGEIEFRADCATGAPEGDSEHQVGFSGAKEWLLEDIAEAKETPPKSRERVCHAFVLELLSQGFKLSAVVKAIEALQQ
jgi:hypothetical protein